MKLGITCEFDKRLKGPFAIRFSGYRRSYGGRASALLLVGRTQLGPERSKSCQD